MESSVIYTMGTALDRAKEQGLPVVVLVANDWLHGRVVAVDGQGLLLDTDDVGQCVVRMQAINAVRVGAVEDQFAMPSPLRVAN